MKAISKYSLFLVHFFVFISFTQSQNKKVDSIVAVINTTKNDSLKYEAYLSLGVHYRNDEPTTSLNYFQLARQIGERTNNNSKIANALNQEGWYYYSTGNYIYATSAYRKAIYLAQKELLVIKNESNKKYLKQILIGGLAHLGIVSFMTGKIENAKELLTRAIILEREINDKGGEAIDLMTLGAIYDDQGNYSKALENYFTALKISESIGKKETQGNALQNISLTFQKMNDHKKAKEYLLKAFDIYKEINDKYGLVNAYVHLGYFNMNENKTTEALLHYDQALILAEALKDVYSILSIQINLGDLYFKNAKINKHVPIQHKLLLQKSQQCYNKAKQMALELGELRFYATAVCHLGEIKILEGKYGEAELELKEALSKAYQISSIDIISLSHENLAELYEKTGKVNLAFSNYKLSVLYKDSLKNDENTKSSVQKEMNYKIEKKSALDSLAFAKETEIRNFEMQKKDLEIKSERNIRYFFIAGLLVVIVFAGFIFNRFQVTNRQKKIIEIKEQETQKQNLLIIEQKHLVEEKHKEITDSINYAERIQRSFLATKELLDENLNEYFILFKPKDVVSGDFYWASKLNNGNFAFVTADSTGHGVPGAIMSLLNITSLEKAIETETSPDKILNATRTNIIERLKKDGSIDGGKDGMDCSLISLNKNKTKLQIASAHNPVWIMRGEEVIDVKADKMPVGKHDKQNESFTLQEVDIKKEDMIYTLTDGFPDQFGGPKGKKFMSKKLRELLESISQKPLTEQKEILEQTFSDWVGDLEQIDDVTVIGIRV